MTEKLKNYVILKIQNSQNYESFFFGEGSFSKLPESFFHNSKPLVFEGFENNDVNSSVPKERRATHALSNQHEVNKHTESIRNSEGTTHISSIMLPSQNRLHLAVSYNSQVPDSASESAHHSQRRRDIPKLQHWPFSLGQHHSRTEHSALGLLLAGQLVSN